MSNQELVTDVGLFLNRSLFINEILHVLWISAGTNSNGHRGLPLVQRNSSQHINFLKFRPLYFSLKTIKANKHKTKYV